MNRVLSVIIAGKNMVGPAVNGARGQLDRLKASVIGLRNPLTTVQGLLAGIGLGIGAAEITSFLYSTNRQFQDLLAQLRTIEGDSAGALRVFAKIRGFARTTPYEVDDITEAVVRLKGAGVQMGDEVATAFGDITALKPEKTMKDFALAVEDAAAGSGFERLTEFGIKFRKNGDQIIATFRGQTTVIDNNIQSIQAYLVSVGQMEGVQGAMEERMKTLGGAASNLMDAMGELASTIGEKGGLNEELYGTTQRVTDLTTEVNENADAVILWTQVVLRTIKLAWRAFGIVPTLAWNLVQSFWYGGKTILADANWIILNIVNSGLKALNFMIEQANRLPGVNLSLVKTLDSQVAAAWEATTQAGRDFLQQGRDAETAVRNLGDAWVDLALLATEAGRAQIRAAAAAEAGWGGTPGTGGGGGGGGAGGGGRTPEERLKWGEEKTNKLNKRLGMGLEGPAGLGGGPTGIDTTNPLSGLAEAHQGALSFSMLLGASFQGAVGPAQELEDVIAGGLTSAMFGFGDAVSEAMAAWVSGSEDAGKAFKNAMLNSLAAVSKGMGDHYMAQAVAALGQGLTGNPAGFAAAAKFLAAATMMYAISGGMAGAASSGGGGRGGSARHTAKEDTDRLSGDGRGEAVLVVQGGLLDMTDPRQADALTNAINELRGRRVVVMGNG